jgi:hypothetical protein
MSLPEVIRYIVSSAVGPTPVHSLNLVLHGKNFYLLTVKTQNALYGGTALKLYRNFQVWWSMTVIPASPEAEVRGSALRPTWTKLT